MKSQLCGTRRMFIKSAHYGRLLGVLTLCFTSWQCSRDMVSVPTNQKILAPYEVSLDDAASVAEKYGLSVVADKKGARAAGPIAGLKETIADEDNRALFHVINYAGGGFAIVSADMRAMPILAYSLSGDPFPTKEAATMNGLALWFSGAKAQMKDITKSTLAADSIAIKEWKKYLAGTLNLPKGGRVAGNTNCQEWYTTGQYMCRYSSYFSHNSSNPNIPGPLLSRPEFSLGVAWGQSRIANANAPNAPAFACTSSENEGFCGRSPAGCGPVAMAQVLWYYKASGQFDYNAMPAFSSSSDCSFSAYGDLQLASLMRACGNEAGSIYGFSSTCNTLTFPSNIPGALSRLGLSSGGNLSSFGPATLKNDVYQGNPVILIGTNSDPYFTGFDQHIWVCDGFDEHRYSQYNCDTHQCDELSFLYLYNNWGFSSRGNGWYGVSNFRPNFSGIGNYNQNVRMISGIRR